MDFEQQLEMYAQQRLSGRAVPTDLRLLLQMQWSRTPDSDAQIDPLDEVGIIF